MIGKLDSGFMYSTFKEFKITLSGETVGEWHVRSRSNGVVPKIVDKNKTKEVKAYITEQIKQHASKINWDPLHGDMPASVKIEEWRTRPKYKLPWFYKAAEQGLVAPTTKPDCDNVITLYLDAISKTVLFDDKQIVDLRYIRHYCDKEHSSPCLEMTVRLYYQDYSDIKNLVAVHKEV